MTPNTHILYSHNRTQPDRCIDIGGDPGGGAGGDADARWCILVGRREGLVGTEPSEAPVEADCGVECGLRRSRSLLPPTFSAFALWWRWKLFYRCTS